MAEKLPLLMSITELQAELATDVADIEDDDLAERLAWKTQEAACTRRGCPLWRVTAKRMNITIRGAGPTRQLAWADLLSHVRALRQGG